MSAQPANEANGVAAMGQEVGQGTVRNTLFRRVVFLTCITLQMLLPTASAATSHGDDTAKRLAALEARIVNQDAQLQQQAKQLAAQQAQLDALSVHPAQTAAPAQPAATTADQRIAALEDTALKDRIAQSDRPRVSMSLGRPTISSADDRFTFSPRAVVQLDAAHYDQANRAAATDFRRGSVGNVARENAAAQDLSDGAYFRRARFGFEGTFDRDFSYRLLLELTGSGTEGPARINDAYVPYTGLAPWTLQIGAFSPPANMSDGTSPEDALFPERPTSAELSRALGGADGRIGFSVRHDTPRSMFSLAATTGTVTDAEVFDSQFALVGRTGWLALTDPVDGAYNVHLGASLTYVLTPPDAGIVANTARYQLRFRDRPEIRVDGTRLIDTGPLDAEHASAFGGEIGANWRNFLLEGEYFRFDVARRPPVTPDDLTFNGWYLEGSWVFTGESHRYNVRNGSFQSPRPALLFAPLQGGWGAWELALRYSRMDLNLHAGSEGHPLALGDLRGGEQHIWSFGLNGYLTPNVRVLFSYLNISVDRLNPRGAASATPFGPGAATPPVGVDVGQDLQAWTMRTQYSF